MKSIRIRKLMKKYDISLFQTPLENSDYKYMVTIHHNKTGKSFPFYTDKTTNQHVYKQVLLALNITHYFREVDEEL